MGHPVGNTKNGVRAFYIPSFASRKIGHAGGVPVSALAGVEGEGAGAEEEDGEEAEEHAEVDAGLVHGGPEALVAEERPLGGDDGDGDIDEQRHGHEAAADAED